MVLVWPAGAGVVWCWCWLGWGAWCRFTTEKKLTTQ
jgi:hypothetical protein